METLLPDRAERMGKVPKGKGERYIQRAMELLESYAQIAQRRGMHDGFRKLNCFIISLLQGETLYDAARETKRLLEVSKYLWNRYKFMPFFSTHPYQHPFFGDRVTSDLSGFQNAQPGTMPFEMGSPLNVTLNGVRGAWHFLALEERNGQVMTSGVFEPEYFVMPASVQTYYDRYSESYDGESKDQFIYAKRFVNLIKAMLNDEEITGDEALKLNEIIDEIDALFHELGEAYLYVARGRVQEDDGI